MPRFLIELAHDDEHSACVRALQAIEQYGSHLMTHANWGCAQGVHAGYVIAETESRAEALLLVPPQFRREARIVEVKTFTREDIREMVAELERSRQPSADPAILRAAGPDPQAS